MKATVTPTLTFMKFGLYCLYHLRGKKRTKKVEKEEGKKRRGVGEREIERKNI